MEPHNSSSKVRFLVISDTHSQELGSNPKDRAFRWPLPKADVLLHCGDITNLGGLSEYRSALSMLKEIDAELKLVIAGNHERTLDLEYWKKHRYSDEEEGDHEKAVKMWKGAEAAEAGITYLDEGMYSFSLRSRATFALYASPYQPAFCNWAFPYRRNEDRFNPPEPPLKDVKNIAQNPVPDFPLVDVMMTHGPPLHRLDKIVRGDDVGCPHLLRAICRAKPRLSCFGHIHEGWGAERINWRQSQADAGESPVESITKQSVDLKEAVAAKAAHIDASSSGSRPVNHGETTLLVNAAIMDVNYKPTNAPWLVDLDLTVKKAV